MALNFSDTRNQCLCRYRLAGARVRNEQYSTLQLRHGPRYRPTRFLEEAGRGSTTAPSSNLDVGIARWPQNVETPWAWENCPAIYDERFVESKSYTHHIRLLANQRSPITAQGLIFV